MSNEHHKYTPEEIREISKKGADAVKLLYGDTNEEPYKSERELRRFTSWFGLDADASEDEIKAARESTKICADVYRKEYGIPESISDMDTVSYCALKSKVEQAIKESKEKK